VSGGWAYATVYSIAWAWRIDAPLWGPALMSVALGLLAWASYAVVSTSSSGDL
jgi:hypothetical protein